MNWLLATVARLVALDSAGGAGPMITVTVRRPVRLILSVIFAAACVAFADPSSSIAQTLVDPGCPGGAGTAISVPQSWLAGAPFVVTEMLPRGITLVVTSAGYPSASFA